MSPLFFFFKSNFPFSFTPASTGEMVIYFFKYACIDADEHVLQTIDITVGPAISAPAPSPSQALIAPPLYSSSSSSSTTKPVAPPYSSSSSSKQKPSASQARAILIDTMPSQIQRDFAELSQTEPETKDKAEIPMGYNQYVRLTFSPVYQVILQSK